MLVQETIPAMVWILNTEKTVYKLIEIIGAGGIGFTWDGTILTTNEPQPNPPIQPITTGTQSA